MIQRNNEQKKTENKMKERKKEKLALMISTF